MNTKIGTKLEKRTRALVTFGVAASATLLLSACDIDQTQEAKLPDVKIEAEAGNLPKYEVVKTEDGKMPDVDISAKGGQLPKYDVDVADVEVKQKTKTVEITYPTIDVQMPDEKEPKVN